MQMLWEGLQQTECVLVEPSASFVKPSAALLPGGAVFTSPSTGGGPLFPSDLVQQLTGGKRNMVSSRSLPLAADLPGMPVEESADICATRTRVSAVLTHLGVASFGWAHLVECLSSLDAASVLQQQPAGWLLDLHGCISWHLQQGSAELQKQASADCAAYLWRAPLMRLMQQLGGQQVAADNERLMLWDAGRCVA
jgi:hypothetical protein